MEAAEYERLLRQFRKKPLIVNELPQPLSFGREQIQRLLPHREPFLLVDRLTGLDLEQGLIAGSRTLPAEDPVFRGHFPEFPVYPGCLQLEMIGQLGLCLHHFLQSGRPEIPPQIPAVKIRATRVVGAYYLEPLYPGQDVRLLARMLEYDGLFAKVIGQALAGEKVACVAIEEVCFLE